VKLEFLFKFGLL